MGNEEQIAEKIVPVWEDYVVDLLSYLQGSVEFVQGELPHIANEIITWGLWSNVMYAVFNIIMGMVGLWLLTSVFRSAIKRINDANHMEANESDIFIALVSGLGGIILSLAGFLSAGAENIPNAIKAVVAPRLYLIEYLSNLVN